MICTTVVITCSTLQIVLSRMPEKCTRVKQYLIPGRLHCGGGRRALEAADGAAVVRALAAAQLPQQLSGLSAHSVDSCWSALITSRCIEKTVIHALKLQQSLLKPLLLLQGMTAILIELHCRGISCHAPVRERPY